MIFSTLTPTLDLFDSAFAALMNPAAHLVTRPASSFPKAVVVASSSAADYTVDVDDQLDRQTPRWDKLLRGHVNRLSNLEPGWDGPGSTKISRFALSTADRITRRAIANVDNASAPYFIPGGDGSVQIEWHEKHGELELDIDPSGNVSLWGRDHVSGAEFEGEGESALALFYRWAPRVAQEPHNAVNVQISPPISIVAVAA